MNKVMFSSGKDDWETPDDFFNKYDSVYHFILDAAADESNHKCSRWFGPSGECEDALVASWPLGEGNIWLNPPYSRKLQRKFLEKAANTSLDARARGCTNRIVQLLPARTDTKVFHEIILPHPGREIEFIKGRIKFVGAKDGAPFPSMVVVF